MEWMNISYALAFLAVFVASVSQILLKQSAQTEHKNIIYKFLNWRVLLGYALLFGTTIINVFAYRGVELKVTPMIESTGIIWVTILAVFLLGERPTKRAILSIIVTIVGIIVFSL
ncbi:MAG: multidrug ABC transporter [Lachnospiraceae bacterium]